MMLLLFSTPDLDLQISLFLLAASFIIALIVWAFSRKWLLALIVFSVLGNLSFLANIGSRMFDFYNIKWLGYFSLFIWPLISVALIIKYLKIRKDEKDQKNQ